MKLSFELTENFADKIHIVKKNDVTLSHNVLDYLKSMYYNLVDSIISFD